MQAHAAADGDTFMAQPTYHDSPSPNRRSAWTAGLTLAPAIAAIAIYLPSLNVQLTGDDVHSLLRAAHTLRHPATLFEPWMGGIFRGVPKLALMAGVATGGTHVWVYHALLLLVHASNALLVTRLATRWTGSEKTGRVTGLLFAAGFAAYGKAVMKPSSITLLLGTFFLLLAFERWERSRRWQAAAAMLGALCSHEVTIAAPLVLLFLPTAPARRRAGAALPVFLLAAALLALAPGPLGRLAAREVSVSSYSLLPFSNSPAVRATLSAADWSAASAMVRAVQQPWVAPLFLLAIVWLIQRRRDDATCLGVAWIYAFWLPAAALMSTWDFVWVERRYLYPVSAGACLVTAILLGGIRRDTLRRLLCVCLFAWALLLDAASYWRMHSMSPVDANGLSAQVNRILTQEDNPP